MEQICQSFKGNQDMYGLGIRLGFYIQWLSLILCELIISDKFPSEIATIRMANDSFTVAEFVAILRQLHLKNLSNTMEDNPQSRPEGIQDVDIHIVLLLCFGSSLFVVPLFIWRILTRFKRAYDPMRWNRVRASKLSNQLSGILLAAVSSFQIWFWTKPPDLPACETYMFFFGAAVWMSGKPFRILSALLYSAMVVLEVIWFILFINVRHQEHRDKHESKIPVSFGMKLMYCLVKLGVCAMVIVSTELTIRWNGIPEMHSLDSAGQVIPFVVGLSVLGRVMYLPIRYRTMQKQEQKERERQRERERKKRSWRYRIKSFFRKDKDPIEVQLRRPSEQRTNNLFASARSRV